ncbi:ATP-binding protein [Kitasatospora sp. NPDC050543]|uniref:ATP-binding protein n=1 Tax=Kitasatospora sp. NPDC050543 TaxID=3364054 RepID=UPI0037A941D1
MKQATLKAAGVAALGVAMAAAAAGSASAASGGGLGSPLSTATNPGATSAVTDVVSKAPAGDKVTSTLGPLAPSAGQAVPAAAAPVADAAASVTQGADTRGIGVESTPLSGLTHTLPVPLPGVGG